MNNTNLEQQTWLFDGIIGVIPVTDISHSLMAPELITPAPANRKEDWHSTEKYGTLTIE